VSDEVIRNSDVSFEEQVVTWWAISFPEKVAVGAGAFKPKRVPLRGVDQDPVGFDVAVARRLPRANQSMVPVFRRNWSALGQEHSKSRVIANEVKQSRLSC